MIPRKSLFAALAIPLMLLFPGMPAASQNARPEEKKSGRIEIILSKNYGSAKELPRYMHLINGYASFGSTGVLFTNSPLSKQKRMEIQGILNDVEAKLIKSYAEFISAAQNFSEEQKFVMLSAISHSLYANNYDLSLLTSDPLNQDEFFQKFQNSIFDNSKESLGVCSQISHYVSALAKDLGISSAEVITRKKEEGHAFAVLSGEKGVAIADGFNFFSAQGKEIGKLMEAYQKYAGAPAFQHYFLDSGKFKYEIITPDGRIFLDFLGYDSDLKSLENLLVAEKEITPSSDFVIEINPFLKSFESTFAGGFFKSGEIKGNSNSSLEKAVLKEIGFKKKFFTHEIPNQFLNFLFGDKFFALNARLTGGNMLQSASQDPFDASDSQSTSNFAGYSANLILSTDNFSGLNFAVGADSNIAVTLDRQPAKQALILSDHSVRLGLTYKLPREHSDFQPYLSTKFSFLPANVSMSSFQPYITEAAIGAELKFNDSDFFISLNPSLKHKLWADGFGGEIAVWNDTLKATLEGNFEKSSYQFHPDISFLKAGIQGKFIFLRPLAKELTMAVFYSVEGKNYGSGFDWEKNLDASASFKF
jgi:hypothetical protein